MSDLEAHIESCHHRYFKVLIVNVLHVLSSFCILCIRGNHHDEDTEIVDLTAKSVDSEWVIFI